MTSFPLLNYTVAQLREVPFPSNPVKLQAQISQYFIDFFSRFRTPFESHPPLSSTKTMNIKTISIFSCVCLLCVLIMGMSRTAKPSSPLHQNGSPNQALHASKALSS